MLPPHLITYQRVLVCVYAVAPLQRQLSVCVGDVHTHTLALFTHTRDLIMKPFKTTTTLLRTSRTTTTTTGVIKSN